MTPGGCPKVTSTQCYFVFLAVPAALCVSHVNVREGGVTAHAPMIGHELLCIRSHVRRLNALHNDVGSRAVLVLTVLFAAHLLIILGRPVGAVDGDCRPKVVSDLLQKLHQGGVHKDYVATVLAPEFPYPEALRQFCNAIFGQ